MKELARRAVNRVLSHGGLAITRVGVPARKSSLGYVPARETVSAAEREGLSVCDYVEKLWDQQGDTQRVVDQMARDGIFEAKNPIVLEIGAGTGRYLGKVLLTCSPAKYESYETAPDWAEWLRSQYPIVSHEADGVSLKQTATDSVDVLHAHGVFVYVPFLVAYRYWIEMWRVVKNRGWVVFDIYSEDCMDEQTVEKWLASEYNYPAFLCKGYIVSLFEKHGFSLRDAFMNRHGKGRSEYLVFVRNNAARYPEAPGYQRQETPSTKSLRP